MSPTDPKTEWLNVVAHDLKTPINSVRGCLEMVQQLGPLNERQQQFAARAMAGLQRMEHLVSGLLDISWIDADMDLELSEMSLGLLVGEIVDMLSEAAEKRSIQMRVEVDDSIGTIVADRRRLGQVLDNLMSNAIKYNRDEGQVIVRAVREPDMVRISVQDTGIGISTDDQPRVFERFFRAREGVALKIEGSGLGLAITKAIVQKHRGRIWLESEAGVGTTFLVTLPLRTEVAEGQDSRTEASQHMGEGRDGRVLRRADLASEERDVVNDNIQEKRELTQVDSTGDEL